MCEYMWGQMKKTNSGFLIFLRLMSKKGFYKILKMIELNDKMGYNEVLKEARDNRMVGSDASITIILNALTKLEFLQRKVSTKPIRTFYKLTSEGKQVLKILKSLEKYF